MAPKYTYMDTLNPPIGVPDQPRPANCVALPDCSTCGGTGWVVAYHCSSRKFIWDVCPCSGYARRHLPGHRITLDFDPRNHAPSDPTGREAKLLEAVLNLCRVYDGEGEVTLERAMDDLFDVVADDYGYPDDDDTDDPTPTDDKISDPYDRAVANRASGFPDYEPTFDDRDREAVDAKCQEVIGRDLMTAAELELLLNTPDHKRVLSIIDGRLVLTLKYGKKIIVQTWEDLQDMMSLVGWIYADETVTDHPERFTEDDVVLGICHKYIR